MIEFAGEKLWQSQIKVSSGAQRQRGYIAIVGALVGVVTLYFARKDKEAERSAQRPIIDITHLNLEMRTFFPGFPLGYEVDRVRFSVTNHGYRVASSVIVTLLQSGSGQPIATNLGEVAPNQTVERELENVPQNGDSALRVKLEVQYRDRIDESKLFIEQMCFENTNYRPLEADRYVDTTIPYVATAPGSTEMFRCVNNR